MGHGFALYAFIAVLIVAAVCDTRTRRIPNVVTAGALIAALLLRAGLGVWPLAQGLLGAALALAIVLPLFAARGIGGGDAKLLITVGAFLGPQGLLMALLATALVGGAMSIVEAARRGVLVPMLFDTVDLLGFYLSFGRRGERRSLSSPGAVSVPYGVAIAIGSLAVLVSRGGL